MKCDQRFYLFGLEPVTLLNALRKAEYELNTASYGLVMRPSSINRTIDRIVDEYNKEEKVEAENRDPELLPEFSAHTMRHTFCTRMCEVEPRVKIIQTIMGHSDISTTMDIYHTVTEELKMESFEGLDKKLFQ